MVNEIRIANFKSYAEAVLPLSPLTLLVGANASGKSNAIEAVRFLSWLATGRRLDAIVSDVQEGDSYVRGAIDTLPRRGFSTFSLGCGLVVPDWTDFRVEVGVFADGLRIVDERITAPGASVPLYAVTAPAGQYSHEVQVQYNNFARGGIKPKVPCTDQQAIFTQLETPARFAAGHSKAQRLIPEIVGGLRDFLESMLLLDPNPRRMRQYSFKVERTLKGDGSNLSSVLYHLCEQEQRKAEVLAFIRALPEQDLRDITFLETPRSEVMLQLHESFSGADERWDAPNLSDGTLRVLAVAAALLSAPEGSLVIVEEIDNGVHPSRASMLLESIRRVSAERKLQVLLTSHNPALVDALPPSAIPHLVFCYRDPKTGSSRLVQLEDLPRFPELIARGPLGQLMTRGLLERIVKQQQSDGTTAIVNQRLAWIDALASSGSDE